MTPYQFASNTPVQAVDLDGAESMQGWSIGLTPKQASDAAMGWTKANQKLVAHTSNGVSKSVVKTWSFFTDNMWKADTWFETGKFFEEGILSLSTVKVTPTPRVDAVVKNFENEVIYGSNSRRVEYFAEVGTDALTFYLGSKGLGAVKSVVAAKYMSSAFRIGSKTLKAVSSHLEQFGFRAENVEMLNGMERIAKGELKATEIDLNFANMNLGK